MRQVGFVIGYLLYAGLRVNADDATCLGCHKMIQASLTKQFGHPAMGGGCVSCHVDHTLESGKPLNGRFVKTLPVLCAGCHSLDDPKLATVHRGQPFTKTSCAGCHDPHGSTRAHLLKEFPHPPFAAAKCELCHLPPADGAVKLRARVGDLCLSCHSALRDQLKSAPHTHTLLASGPDNCTSCHTPHTSNRKGLTIAARPNLCLTCHPDTGKKEFAHEPAKRDCLLCHGPHGGLNNNLRAESNALCLECHSLAAKAKLEADAPLSLFGGQVQVPPRSFENLKLIDLRNDRGHPVSNHPVLRSEDKDGPAVSCTVCHAPHGANNSASLLVTETEVAVTLCQRCHK